MKKVSKTYSMIVIFDLGGSNQTTFGNEPANLIAL